MMFEGVSLIFEQFNDNQQEPRDYRCRKKEKQGVHEQNEKDIQHGSHLLWVSVFGGQLIFD